MSDIAGTAWVALALIIGVVIAHCATEPKRKRQAEDDILDAADEIRTRRHNDRG